MESDSFSIHSLAISPEVSELGGPVEIQLEFISPQSLDACQWRVYYVIDTIRKRKNLEVCALPTQSFVSGVNCVCFHIPSIDVDSLNNITAGVLLLTLTRENEELLAINMIVQVTQRDGRKCKTIFSPLE